MKSANKTFEFNIQFNSFDMKIKARNRREAKMKAAKRLKAMPASRLMDKKNSSIDEI